MTILVGAIGAKTTLALIPCQYNQKRNKYTIDSDFSKVPRIIVPTTNSVEDLQKTIRQFLADNNNDRDAKNRILGASFSIEGQILDGGKKCRVQRDNLDLSLSINELRQSLPHPGLPINFSNDMVQIGNALLFEEAENNCYLLYQGDTEPNSKERKCIMLVSDGLGQSMWQWAEIQKTLFPNSSEGGHCRFAAQNQKQWDLCLFIKEQIKEKEEENQNLDNIKVEFEDVLSRRGLIHIYNFLKENDYNGEELSDFKELLELDRNNETEAKIVDKIIEKATQSENPDSLCVETLNMFLTIWGARAGDLAITYESKGGIYIGGISIPTEKLKDGTFTAAFLEENLKNSRNYENNKNISVQVFNEEDIVLYGAARYAIKAGYINRGKLVYEQI